MTCNSRLFQVGCTMRRTCVAAAILRLAAAIELRPTQAQENAQAGAANGGLDASSRPSSSVPDGKSVVAGTVSGRYETWQTGCRPLGERRPRAGGSRSAPWANGLDKGLARWAGQDQTKKLELFIPPRGGGLGLPRPRGGKIRNLTIRRGCETRNRNRLPTARWR